MITDSPTHVVRRAVQLAAALCLMSASATAQGYPFSQRSTLVQNVARTEITISYGRPIARGRALFGRLVPWDSVWHPGADSATRITFDHDVRLDGREVKAGAYSIWLVPREHGPWTFILSRKAHVFHTPYPGASDDAFRTDVVPESLSHMETMAIYFPVVVKDTAIMRIHWGTTALPIRVAAPYRPE